MAFAEQISWLRQMQTLIKHDARKATVLAVLVAVLLGLWGKMALTGGRGTPPLASAMIAPVIPGLDEQRNKSRAIDSASLLRAWLETPLPTGTSRNLFEVKLDYFPMDGSHLAEHSRTENDPTFWDQLAKSIDAQADQQHKREILIQNLRQQAGQLQLTSIVMGTRPKAMISGAMVGQGDVVAEFRVLRIEPRLVVVEREGIKLEIPMK